MTTKTSPPKLITPGIIAQELSEPLHRVLNVLATRRHIQPSARAGTLRLYDRKVVAMVRHELNAIDARRCGRAAAPRHRHSLKQPSNDLRAGWWRWLSLTANLIRWLGSCNLW